MKNPFSKRSKEVKDTVQVGMVGGAAVASQDEQDRILRELTNPVGATETEERSAIQQIEVAEINIAQPGDVIAATDVPATGETVEQKAARVEAEKAAKKAEKAAAAATKKSEREAAAKVKADEKAAAKKVADEKKAEKKAAKAAEVAAKPKVVHYGADKVSRIKATLGNQLGDYMVLTTADALLTGDALVAAQEATMASIGKMGCKVQNRTTFLFDFLSGKTAPEKINAVMGLALKTLAKDSKIVTGDKGNMHAAMLGLDYAPMAARSMGNNTLNVLRTLKLVIPGADKQTLVANPESLLLLKANSLLGI